MTRLTFDDLTPADMPEPFYDDSGDRADAYMDGLASLVRCGQQTSGDTDMTLTTANVLACRPDDAKIPAELVNDIVEECCVLNALLQGAQLLPLNHGDVVGMWAADPVDLFGMFDDYEVRLGLDKDAMLGVCNRMFERLDDEAQVMVLAHKFAENVRNTLDPTEFADVVLANKLETGSGVCHSHDYMDANECMLDALNHFDLTFDPANQDQCTLMNAAWAMAKKNDFADMSVQS